jgi:hypothetical protein
MTSMDVAPETRRRRFSPALLLWLGSIVSIFVTSYVERVLDSFNAYIPGLGLVQFSAWLLFIALTLYGFAIFTRWVLQKLFWTVGRRLFLSYVMIGMRPSSTWARRWPARPASAPSGNPASRTSSSSTPSTRPGERGRAWRGWSSTTRPTPPASSFRSGCATRATAASRCATRSRCSSPRASTRAIAPWSWRCRWTSGGRGASRSTAAWSWPRSSRRRRGRESPFATRTPTSPTSPIAASAGAGSSSSTSPNRAA